MKFLDQTAALREIRELLASADRIRLAVAFWGASAIERLGLDRDGLSADILCNLDSGACNPAEVRRLRDMPGISLKSHASLHAKVYWTTKGAVLGSSNASANGLALEGDAASGWAEANVLITDSATMTALHDWFDLRFCEGNEITDADLQRAERIWKARARMIPTGKRLTGDLLTAYDNAPSHPAWKHLKLAYWKDELDDPDERWLEEQQEGGRLDPDVSAYADWNDKIGATDWVLDFDLSSTSPAFGGIWRALPHEASRANLRLVRPVEHVSLPGLGRLRLKTADQLRLTSLAPQILKAHSEDRGRNAVVDLAGAMALAQPQSTPTEKAFHAAMDQIYSEAVAIGYRPGDFRRMLYDLGGLETARRLVRGHATYGFEKLWERKRLDLSVEALILKPEWQPLFSPEELRMAKKRLKDYQYTPGD